MEAEAALEIPPFLKTKSPLFSPGKHIWVILVMQKESRVAVQSGTSAKIICPGDKGIQVLAWSTAGVFSFSPIPASRLRCPGNEEEVRWHLVPMPATRLSKQVTPGGMARTLTVSCRINSFHVMFWVSCK